MPARRIAFIVVLFAAMSLSTAAAQAQGTQTQTEPFEPTVGQPGKDVVWVPTPQELVDRMLDMAEVTPQDYLVDLGSGDGRTVITAARRGLRARGIEFNPEMVELSRKNAAEAGVSERATFDNANLFESDFSNAQVITMFLLPSINLRLRSTLLDLTPGTRIVSNSFTMGDWTTDDTQTLPDCTAWCTAHLWIVPAKVEGTWQTPQDSLTLTQQYQMISGKLGGAEVLDGRLRGTDITFSAGGTTYTGQVEGNTMNGTTTAGAAWTATRQ